MRSEVLAHRPEPTFPEGDAPSVDDGDPVPPEEDPEPPDEEPPDAQAPPVELPGSGGPPMRA